MFTIKTSKGYFAGQDAEQDRIFFTANIEDSHKFLTRAAAEYFIRTWADAGYGLSSDDAQVVYVPLNP